MAQPPKINRQWYLKMSSSRYATRQNYLWSENAMRRTSTMAIGFILIFIGIQLNLVETYTLSPRFSNFLSAHTRARPASNFNNGNGLIPNTGFQNPNFNQANSPYSQASFQNGNNSLLPQPALVPSYGPPKVIRPPSWICWPVLFLGTVVFLHGFSTRGNY